MRNSRASQLLRSRRAGTARAGFTLLELLVILGTMALLALMLLPALANSKPHNQAAQCQNNLRQLTAAWLMYAADNLDTLMLNPGWAGGTMDWTARPDNTNTVMLTDPSQSQVARYVNSAALFKCPADIYQSAANPGPRVRSISLNAAIGNFGGPTVMGTAPDGRIYYGGGAVGAGSCAMKLFYLNKPGPAQVYIFLDEHPDSINDGTFMLDPGYTRSQERWRDLPGSLHNAAGSLSYADGHAEIHSWQDPRTLVPVLLTADDPWKITYPGASADYEWLQDRMPYREE